MNLTIPHFAVRCDATISLAEMALLVAKAIGCQLVIGSYHKIPAACGKLVGMNVGLYEWGGMNGMTFRFEGEVEDNIFLNFMNDRNANVLSLDVGQLIADILMVVTGFDWRLPTAGDIAAERAYGDDVEKHFSSTE